MKQLLSLTLTALLFSSCNDAYGQKMDVIGIPIVFAIISLFGLILGIKLSKSGTTEIDGKTGKRTHSDTPFPFFAKENYGMVIFVSFLIAAVATYFYMRAGN